MKKLLLCLPILFLTACEPTVFGIPQSTFNSLTPQQKQQVIDAYNQREQIKAENAPLESAISTLGFIANTNHH